MSILDRFRLDGKVAIVTGASSGFGVDFARGLAEAGADVALGARRPERLETTKALVEERGRRAIAVATDVTDRASCQALVDATVAELGRVDILINNAGIGGSMPALRETPEHFLGIMDVNINGCYWMAQAAANAMTEGGSIVNIASILGIRSVGLPQAAYVSSKAALIALTRDLAQQWMGRRNIRVNCVLPGFFLTEMTEGVYDQVIKPQLGLVPAGRAGEPEELTACIVFLASDAASYVTGEGLVVDGGRVIF